MSENCSSRACVDKPNKDQFKSKGLSNYLNKELELEKYYPERPLFRTEIGRMTWRTFHRFSVLFNGEEKEKEHFSNFVIGLEKFFPCPVCRNDLKIELEKMPVKSVLNNVESDKFKNSSLIEWVCIQHNHVNEKLGYKAFDCNVEKLRKEYSFI
jgi:FAD-linked sulfhydryl oxidase